MANDANRVINGTSGRIWINGELWAETKSFEAMVNATYEDVNYSEDYGTYKKYTGFTGEGTLVLNKTHSRGINMLSTAFKTGIMPNIKIVTKLADPASFGAERAEILGVTLNNFTASKFELKALQEEELSFNFSDYNFLEIITP